jgi:hypothetical protein
MFILSSPKYVKLTRNGEVISVCSFEKRHIIKKMDAKRNIYLIKTYISLTIFFVWCALSEIRETNNLWLFQSKSWFSHLTILSFADVHITYTVLTISLNYFYLPVVFGLLCMLSDGAWCRSCTHTCSLQCACLWEILTLHEVSPDRHFMEEI